MTPVPTTDTRPAPNLMHRVRRIHFVGVGGAGMSGIADVLAHLGFEVSGSDLRESTTVRALRSAGITVTIVAAQAEYIPAEIEPGLSSTMTGAVAKTCDMLKRILSNQLNEVTLDDV